AGVGVMVQGLDCRGSLARWSGQVLIKILIPFDRRSRPPLGNQKKALGNQDKPSYRPIRYITYTADMPASASAMASTVGRRRKGEMSRPSTRATFSTMATMSVGTRTSAW